MDNQKLQNEFIAGTVPDTLQGFYRGGVEMIYPDNASESLVSMICSIWNPWKGKYFYEDKKGDNILSPVLMWIVRIRFGDFFDHTSSDKRFHAFPFHTDISQSLYDDRPVLQLSYNLPQNPPIVRGIIDEIVWVADKQYLGKMYSNANGSYRLTAWFRLYATT